MLRLAASLTLAVDADLSTIETVIGPRRSVAIGVEQRLGRLVARGGGRVNTEDDDSEPVGAFGLSLELNSGLWVDGQLTGGRDEGDRGWGISTRVGF